MMAIGAWLLFDSVQMVTGMSGWFSGMLGAGRGGARHEADDLEAGEFVVGQGVGAAHVAGADTEDTERGLAHASSITLPSPASSREKASNRN